MKARIIFLFLIIYVLPGNAQNQPRKLQRGDTLPDLPSLAAFKGKPLILDFWDVYCASCIRQFPKAQAMQTLYGDAVQIVLVTRSTEEQVNKLMAHNETLRNCRLPMLVGDSSVSVWFPCQTYPAHAWINSGGVLKEFTGAAHALDSGHIQQFLDGKELLLPPKNEWGDFNPDESLITEGAGRNLSKLKYYSLLTSWANYDGRRQSNLIDSTSKKKMVFI